MSTTSFALITFAAAGLASAQSVRVLKFSEGQPFRMGKVTSMRILQPSVGATQLSLNYSESEDGSEFAQHVHDHSDDHILLLQGQAYLRQGDSKTPVHAGQCVIVPAGQIHGTITTGEGKTIMISFQVPPDPALYTGARDSSLPGAVPPKGIITPEAVKYIPFADRNGVFLSPHLGAERATAAYQKLNRGESVPARIDSGSQGFVFVWRGAIQAKYKGGAYAADARDTIFINGPADVEVRSNADDTVVILAQAPPHPGS